MSLKPVAPKRRTTRGIRPAGAPVVVVQKKQSGSGGLLMGILLLAALGGGYFVYNNQQKNEAALAVKQAKLEANAAAEAENERLRAEQEKKKNQQLDPTPTATALGTVAEESTATSPQQASSDGGYAEITEEEPEEEKSALGSTAAPTAGTGVFNVEDTSAPPFDLKASGKAEKKVIDELDKAIDKAGDGDTYHDLQADLKRSFDVAQPGLFADATTLPTFPDKEHKLLRLAHGVYVCLTIAAELDAQGTVPEKQHAKFVNWLMKEKAKSARTFAYGLEHYNIHDVAKATELLGELRSAYLVAPSAASKKIKPILEKGSK